MIANVMVGAAGIAEAIRREHEAAAGAARSALDHAMECGRLLAAARVGIPHGAWESFVRERCGIPERTARMYLRLDANRDRLTDRQHVAGLTVREAVRVLSTPRVKAEPVAEVVVNDIEPAAGGDELRLAAPSWYRAGHRHFGHHPSEWFFETWPHPAGEQWAHFYVCSPMSGYPGDETSTLTGPKRGIAVRAIEWAIDRQAVNGMPPLSDAGWAISDSPCTLDDASDPFADRYRHFNTMLFAGEDDYRRRGMGLVGRRASRHLDADHCEPHLKQDQQEALRRPFRLGGRDRSSSSRRIADAAGVIVSMSSLPPARRDYGPEAALTPAQR